MKTITSYLLIGMSITMMLMLVFVTGCTETKASAIEIQTRPPTTVPTIAPTVIPTIQITPDITQSPPVSTGQRQTIKISGSTTVLPIVQKAADQYMTTHPDADIQITGGGSGVGIQAIGAKTVDIGMTSRDVTKAEMAKYPQFVITTVAKDGIAIITSPKNEIQYITLDQLKNIYLGNTVKWTQITGANVPNTNNKIVVIGRDSASGTRAYFDETILLKATPTKNMLERNSNGAVLQSVAQTPSAIGYVSIGFISDDVKVLPIWYNYDKIISPTSENVKSKNYPISRDLYVVTNGQPTGLTKDFINYILGPEGQKIAEDEGYITI